MKARELHFVYVARGGRLDTQSETVLQCWVSDGPGGPSTGRYIQCSCRGLSPTGDIERAYLKKTILSRLKIIL